ncbi:MAG: DNA repair protein RecN [Bryobacteraceae bacterium]|nr:DNA repair protein RecN [Bryobacteraceae bacterium]
MLLELNVENYAVVETLRLRFHAGFNVLTGETGSGKSIVVDALGLLFGGRSSAEMLRSGTERARISGIFEVPRWADSILSEAGIIPEDGEVLIEREITSGGKSRAFAGSRPVTASVLREIAPALGDIHGQHDQQRLFNSDAQRDIVDTYGDHAERIGELKSVFQQWQACATEIASIDKMEQEKLRLLDLWSFQQKEIEGVRLKAGEDVELEAERRVQQNVSRLLESANAAYSALYDAQESAYAQIRVALRKLEDSARIDEKLADVAEILKPSQIGVEEASANLRDYIGTLEADPARLDEIESRLGIIDKLKRKYGTTIDEILAFLQETNTNIALTESTAERRAAIEARRRKLASDYEALAEQLTAVRTSAGIALSRQVMLELESLAMERTRFEVRVTPVSWSASGADAVAFYVSANLGEEPRPIEKVASGGELSRIALALRTCTSSANAGRTLVFDEVDAGIGGTAAETVGRRLKALAGNNQVLCVTHLAQIAGFADHHYSVEKREVNGRTIAAIEELTGEKRTREIGRMLAGQRLTPEVLHHARQLIEMSTLDEPAAK